MYLLFWYWYGGHRDLNVLTRAFPTRGSSEPSTARAGRGCRSSSLCPFIEARFRRKPRGGAPGPVFAIGFDRERPRPGDAIVGRPGGRPPVLVQPALGLPKILGIDHLETGDLAAVVRRYETILGKIERPVTERLGAGADTHIDIIADGQRNDARLAGLCGRRRARHRRTLPFERADRRGRSRERQIGDLLDRKSGV